jgi:hypothetical protein
MRGTPINSLGLCNKSGWSTAELFMEVLKHIQKYTQCKAEPGRQILLLMDNSETHITVDIILFCRENGIIMLSFPPHTSHKLQPLDVGVFGPFKSSLKVALNNWTVNHPGQTISIYDIGEITKAPFLESCKPKKNMSGFYKPGVCAFY